MLRPALAVAGKDLRLTFSRGAGLSQALLLGLLLIFLFSLAREPGQAMSPQAAAAVFWLASLFCQVLIFNNLYTFEEDNAARLALALSPAPLQSVWLGKGLAGLALLGAAQLVLAPAAMVFLAQTPGPAWTAGLAALLAVDLGMAVLGSLLGALAQGQAGRESLLSIVLFPLLTPLLLAGVRVGAAGFSPDAAPDLEGWLGLAVAFDLIFAAAGVVLFPFIYSGEE